jgi:tetratricopeptide (TPR) repeat protein
MRLAVVAVVLLGVCTPARSDDMAEARAEYKQATTEYALGNYAEAARHYERAFALTQDAAVLYNAAQAHRAAGNKPRALQLYQNYIRVFGKKVENKDEVLRFIAQLKAAIEEDKKAEAAAPVEPKPVEKPAEKPAVVEAPAPVVVAQPAAPPPEKPKSKLWVVGVVVGVVAAVGIGVGLGVGLGLPHDPSASYGVAAVR